MTLMKSSPPVSRRTNTAIRPGKRDSMKRAIISGLVLLLVMVGATVTAGCGGGDTGQARKYVKLGDQLTLERGGKNTELLTAWKTVRETADPVAKGAAWEQAQSIYNDLQALVQKEKAEYGKIKGLKGVGDYVKYAELKILALNALDQSMKSTNDFLQKLYNNGFGSQQEKEAALQQYQAEAEKLQAENTRANEEAKQLKKDKNL
jgi:hypothetical protein